MNRETECTIVISNAGGRRQEIALPVEVVFTFVIVEFSLHIVGLVGCDASKRGTIATTM